MNDVPAPEIRSEEGVTADAAELETLREGGRMLGRITARLYRVMEAARIELHQNGPHAAMQWVLNAADPVPDGDDPLAWDGNESADEWWDRVEAADSVAEAGSRALDDAAATGRLLDCDEHHDLVRDFGGKRPLITCLCGSTRFYDAFQAANLRLTLAGEIVLSIGCDTKSDGDLAATDALGKDPEQVKADLDELHKRKIDLADRVLVVGDESGYFGNSTAGEIRYAAEHGKPVGFAVPAAEARARELGLIP